MTTKRRTEIQLLNVLFCLLVIFIHIVSYAVAGFAQGSLKYNIVMIPWRLVSFVVQGFVLLSGVKLFLTGKDNLTFGRYLSARLRSVILPYALSFVLYYLFYFAIYDYPLDAVFIIKHFVLGSLVCHMYFIPIIFQFDLLFPIWKAVINKCSPIIVIPFTLLISVMFESFLPNMISIAFPSVNFNYNDRIFTTYLAFWIIGCYIGKYYSEFIAILKRNFKTICAVFSAALVLCVYFSYIAFNNIAYVPFMTLLHSIYALCTIIFLYALTVRIPSSLVERSAVVSKIDRASYDIYLWHMLVLFFSDFVIQKLGIASQGLSFIIRTVLVYGVTITLCILFGWLKNKLKRQPHVKANAAQ